MKFKVIIFDFDGVLLESVDIKDYAFKTLFKDYPEHLEEIMDYHLSNNATVRFDKFKYITENILCKNYDKETEKKLSKIFSDLVFRRLVECPFVKGAKEILVFLQDKIPIYIASRSPAAELEKILEIRKLKKYFKKVYAVPWLKHDAIEDIKKSESVSPEEIAFIGDADEDLKAAQSTGVYFIGRDSGKSFNEASIPLFKDMFEVRDFLRGF